MPNTVLLLWIIFLHASTVPTSSSGARHAVERLMITPSGTQIKTTDSGIIFTCTLISDESPDDGARGGSTAPRAAGQTSMSWRGPQMQLLNDTKGRVYVERPDDLNLRLYITRIQESDAGHYTCVVEYSQDGTVQEITEETKMFLYEDIKFNETPIHERAVLGSSAFLQCQTRGQPTPEVTWRFNHKRIIPSTDPDKYEFRDNGMLINGVDLKDNGTYECRAEVESHGNVKIRLVSLEVLYPPQIRKEPSADLVIKGHEAILQCKADGNPPVHYEWFKEQKMSEMVRVKVRLAEKTDTYVISGVTSEDEGRYFCRVSNTIGTKEVSVDVKMLVPPEIHHLPERLSVVEGGTLNVSCSASGLPPPKIIWSMSAAHNEHNVPVQSDRLAKSGVWRERSLSGTTILTIQDVQTSYAGNISCIAFNDIGKESRTVSLSVEHKPTILMEKSDQIGWSGETRSFRCVSQGLPLPTLNWFRGGQYIVDSDIYQISSTKSSETVDSTLTISLDSNQPWAYGNYSCIAKNIHGYVTATARLTEAVLPDMPRNVSVLEETSTSVTLSAKPPSNTGGMAVTAWSVSYEAEFTGSHQHTEMFDKGDRIILKNLLPGTTYTVYLSVGNSVGFGQPLKFRIFTPKKSSLKEQADVPDANTEVDRTEKYSEEVEDSKKTEIITNIVDRRKHDGITEVSEKEANIAMDSVSGVMPDRNESLVMAIAVGSAVVLIALFMAFTCGLLWSRRKGSSRSNRGSMAPSSLGNPSDNYFMLYPSRNPNDSLPEISNVSDPAHAHQTTDLGQAFYGTFPRRVISPKLSHSTLPPQAAQRNRTKTVAPQANETHTAGRRNSFETNVHCEEISQEGVVVPSTTEGNLPPPPEFMLHPTTAPIETVATSFGLFMDEILDGYHSGDNVDDDIDDVDYTIRIPSFHGQICNYTSSKK